MSMAKFTLRTTTLLVLVFASVAPVLGFAQVGGKCGIELNKPADDVQHHANFMSAAKALNIPSEAAPADEAAARKSLCSGTCRPWEATDTRDGINIHVLIADDSGGVWVVSNAGWIGGSSACNIGEPHVRHANAKTKAHGIYLITLDEKAGNAGADEGGDEGGDYCGNATYATSVTLLDLKAKVRLVEAVNIEDGDRVHFDGREVEVSACGRTAVAKLSALRAGTVKLGGKSPALALLQRGRKLTAQKDYKGAIAALREAVEEDENLAQAWSSMGYALLKAQDYKASERAFRKALKLSPARKFQAMVYYNLGMLADETQDQTAAKAAFEKSHALRPTPATKRVLKRYNTQPTRSAGDR